MRHTESVYTVQPTPLYTHSQTGKRHFHFERSMLTLTSRSKWMAETVKNSKSYITVSTKIPEIGESGLHTIAFYPKSKASRRYCLPTP